MWPKCTPWKSAFELQPARGRDACGIHRRPLSGVSAQRQARLPSPCPSRLDQLCDIYVQSQCAHPETDFRRRHPYCSIVPVSLQQNVLLDLVLTLGFPLPNNLLDIYISRHSRSYSAQVVPVSDPPRHWQEGVTPGRACLAAWTRGYTSCLLQLVKGTVRRANIDRYSSCGVAFQVEFSRSKILDIQVC